MARFARKGKVVGIGGLGPAFAIGKYSQEFTDTINGICCTVDDDSCD